jgi:hypothetical protein
MKHSLAATVSVCALILLNQSIGRADQPPTAEEVRRVTNYFYNQRDSTPLLADYKLCAGIHREGSNKNNCAGEIEGGALEPGQSLFLWMNFLVPKGQRGKVLVQLNHDGITRGTREMSIRGSMRYRTWRKIRLQRTGEWELPVYYENSDGIEEIERINLQVTARPDISAPEKITLNKSSSPSTL